jgi:hypothetical protein
VIQKRENEKLEDKKLVVINILNKQNPLELVVLKKNTVD